MWMKPDMHSHTLLQDRLSLEEQDMPNRKILHGARILMGARGTAAWSRG